MLIIGLACCYGSLAVFVLVSLKSATPQLALDRRRPASGGQVSVLSRMTGVTAGRIDDLLQSRGWARSVADGLEYAGVKLAPADFLILAVSAALLAGAAGFILGGSLLAVVFAAVCLAATSMLLRVLAAKRRHAFANQLDDSLQLLAGSLRAGHSLLRAIDAVSQQAESPTAQEFARIINETRLGRDTNEALDQTAQRMASEDFSWVAQAIAIHREVGGDLAEVLDQVGRTIRERNQIQRQVKALSAEGKMSAYVLMALPVLIIGVLSVISPSYITQFGESVLGYAMLAVGAIMMIVGALWLRKIVSFKF